MQFFAKILAPIIVILCGVALLLISLRRFRAGQTGRAMLDIVWAIALFILAYMQYFYKSS
ncbi:MULTISPECIES: hypothetical protein [Aminobacterium]|uniref:hypothetical protein n=1 Tax=Aminobacterium TaxID=81466 RepID=UPI0016B4D7F2|nr:MULTISPECIES: hypothetical protein [unclassified Aminobacterium]MDD2379123.1 hypothetical protein [Aminobacterium colombiense]MDD3768378.1 hypothetical protein [Aminobacterium colombiense]MDD4266536.1 hypothetical protein [Aminobacterium colombiense]MDD4586607.1 hypothetical protein [Aminobacterium colombiense]NLK31174.1 hypothetical protein [Aminobacterium colombiense]